MATDHDVELLTERQKVINVKLELLDANKQYIEDISGYVTSATVEISGESDIRRTASISMYVPSKSYLISSFSRIRMDYMIHLHLGIFDKSIGDFVWYPLGYYLISDNQYTYDATSQTLSISLVDMMAALTDTRGSQLGTGTLIPEGSNVRGAIMSFLTASSPYRFVDVMEFSDTIPYDIETSLGSYPIDTLNSIIKLFPYNEMFYSKDGVFTVQPIPTGIDDEISISNTIIDQLITSEGINGSYSMAKIKNTTELWGQSLDAVYTAESCTTNVDTYELYINEDFERLVDNETYSFTPTTSSVSGMKLKIQETTAYAIYAESGNGTYTAIPTGAMEAGIPYSVKYLQEKFILQGELEIHVIVQEIDQEPSSVAKEAYKQDNACRCVYWVVNPNSPFAARENEVTHRIEGVYKQVLSDGEYSNIYTTDLAKERAAYENWKTTRLQDTVSFNSIIIPWIDVNQKIQVYNYMTEGVETYMVQSISMDLVAFTMSVSCITFQPAYPWA